MAGQIFGADGRSLKEHWAGTGMQAYCGTTIPGFPNFFMLAGPNTGIGHTSLVVMIEAQVAHVIGALEALKSSGAGVVDVRPEVLARWGQTCRRKAAADGMELGRVLELVSRMTPAQHHPLARLHLPLRPQDPQLRSRRLCPLGPLADGRRHEAPADRLRDVHCARDRRRQWDRPGDGALAGGRGRHRALHRHRQGRR